MVKALLFDADHVVINKPTLWSQRLMEDYGIPANVVLPFFQNEFQACLVGRADLKEELKKYIFTWGWKKSVDELLVYWFNSEHYVDERVIDKINGYRNKGIVSYLATDQEKYRTEYIRNEMGLGSVFGAIFSSAYIGAKKSEQGFWKTVVSELAPLSKENLLLWDDDSKNIESAGTFGLVSELYTSYDDFSDKMAKYGL